MRRRHARYVDEALSHLAHQEARCRRALGLLALALLRQQAHQHLGFVRLGDYTRERLGLSAREIQSFAQVVHTMEQLPLIAGAFARAELSWAQVRAVVRVATQATEASWLARARGLTVRVLEDLVRDACGGGSTAEGPPAGAPPVGSEAIVTPAALTAAAAAVADEDAGRIDGEPAVRLRLRCPRRVRVLWRAVVELVRRMAGEPLPVWRSFARLLEHVRAEWECPPRHPDPIFARDGGRCAVPACSARGRLHDHHIHYRSRGGDNERGNRIAVCAQHHLRAIHAGCIHARGIAPDAVHWELGVRPGRPPLLRFVGDRYVGTQP